ncbi:MAG: hypothetical protein AAGG01_18310 [Planctomycetota bacterium]
MESDPHHSPDLVPDAPDTSAQHDGFAVAADYPVDAIVTVYGGLVFVTTGGFACTELGVAAEQLAVTPAVALRIAAVLRDTLQHGDLRQRGLTVEVWSASEITHMPHGRVWIDEQAIHFTIEPLGAGAQITVGWLHVPGLILSLETAAQELLG